MRHDPWELWYAKHRDTELADLVFAAVKVLLERGVVTADDMRAVPLKGDPRIRGGAIRSLRYLGLIDSGIMVKSTAEICHKRPIGQFLLIDAALARRIMAARNAVVTDIYKVRKTRKGTDAQFEMAI